MWEKGKRNDGGKDPLKRTERASKNRWKVRENKGMKSNREEEDHGTEMQSRLGLWSVSSWELWERLFLDVSATMLSTPKCLLFTINFCISSEALLCPSICSPLLLFSSFCVSALIPSGLHHLVENLTILFKLSRSSIHDASQCWFPVKSLVFCFFFFFSPSKLLNVATHRNKQKI